MNTSTASTRDQDDRSIAHNSIQKERRELNRLSLTAAVAGCIYFLGHGLSVIFGSEQRVMEWLYDDCFYYLITAKHFSEQHIPSFDGITLTSGYHPLWMWLCAIVYRLHGRLDLTYVRGCMTLSLTITTAVLFAAVRTAIVRRNNGMLWAIGLGTTSYSALNNSASVMEWPLVVLCWYLLHQIVVKGKERPRLSGMIALGAAFLIGFAGSLSRSDFGLIPACYVVAAFACERRLRSQPVLRGIAATCGAIAGVAADFVYNHRMTGSWLQTSAEVKRVFASVTTVFNPAPALWQFARILLYLPPTAASHRGALMHAGIRAIQVGALCLVVFAALGWRRLRNRFSSVWSKRSRQSVAPLAAATGVAGYLVVYGFDSLAAYGWYSAAVTGFVLILAAELFSRLRPAVAAWIVFPLMAANALAATFYGGNAREQMQEVATGKRMHAEHRNAVMGGGDVGKPSFYNDGRMINLDGLMNNEVYPYLVSGRIHCYVLERHIEYLSDVGSITVPLTNAERQKRNEPPIPWANYFESIRPSASGVSDGYLQTNFAAIRASGECNQYNQQ